MCLDSYDLAGHRFRNRLVVAPMSRTRADHHGVVGPETGAYYDRYAMADVGGIVTEAFAIGVGVARAYFYQAAIADADHRDAWAPLASLMAKRGVPFLAQLQHAGPLAEPGLHDAPPISPIRDRACGLSWQRQLPHPAPRAADQRDLAFVVVEFAAAARNAVSAGFAGVELHAARGYLLHQHLLKSTNGRSDRYGGSLEGRLLLPAEVARAVRVAVGQSALLTLNFSVDRMDNPSAPLEEDDGEFRELIEALCDLPIDALHFSTRDHATTMVHGAPAVHVVRRAATKPLISGGNVRSLAEADALLDAGADLVAVGRTFLANPDWIGRELRGLPSRPFARGIHLVPAGNDDLRVPPGDALAAWPLMLEEA